MNPVVVGVSAALAVATVGMTVLVARDLYRLTTPSVSGPTHSVDDVDWERPGAYRPKYAKTEAELERELQQDIIDAALEQAQTDAPDADSGTDHDPDIRPEHLRGEWTLGDVESGAGGGDA